MKVSVLINNYNYGRFLRDCILSAKAQDYKNLEIVVVDDGSTDNSKEVLTEFESEIILVEQANGGQLSAIAAGSSHCSGHYVFLLDSDDFWPSNYISTVMEAIERKDAPDIVFSGVVNVDRDGTHPRVAQSYPMDIDYGYNYLISQYSPRWLGQVTSAIAIKRAALTTIISRSSSVADRYRINADDVLVIGADLLGFRKVMLAGARIFYRVHGGNAWANAVLSNQRKHQFFILKCVIFPLLSDFRDSNPWLRLGMPFAGEFETKANVPFVEVVRYVQSVFLYGKSHRLRQIWRIFAHWRATGTTRNRLIRLALKRRPVTE